MTKSVFFFLNEMLLLEEPQASLVVAMSGLEGILRQRPLLASAPSPPTSGGAGGAPPGIQTPHLPRGFLCPALLSAHPRPGSHLVVLVPSPPQPGPCVVGAPHLTRFRVSARDEAGRGPQPLSREPPGSPAPAGSPPFWLVFTMRLTLGVLVFYFF